MMTGGWWHGMVVAETTDTDWQQEKLGLAFEGKSPAGLRFKQENAVERGTGALGCGDEMGWQSGW
jgi:hypothetical protein